MASAVESKLGYLGTLVISGYTAQHIKDVSVETSAAEVDDTTRYCNGWKSTRAGLREWSVSFQLLRVNSDSVYSLLKTAFKAGSIISTVTVTDAWGDSISGPVSVTGFKRNEPLGDVVTVDVTLKGRGEPTF